MITVNDVKEFNKIGTHSGSFHADDVFCTAFLKLINDDLIVIRSRDNSELSTCDFIFDVSIGGIYNVYDHHGIDRVCRDGKDSYIAYSAFGLEEFQLLFNADIISHILRTSPASLIPLSSASIPLTIL